MHFNEISTRLGALRKKDVEISASIIGENLLLSDLFFISSADRSARLIDGFLPLLQSKNLTSAAPLLRLQIDNCLRTYAAFLVDDPDDFSQRVLFDNVKVSSIRDRDGKKMSDVYLRQKLSEIDPKVSDAYIAASGFIHLSDKALFTMVDTHGDYQVTFNVGGDLKSKLNNYLIECGLAFVHFTQLHLALLKKVADAKVVIDAGAID